MRIAVVRPAVFGTPTSDTMMPLLFAILKPLTPPDIDIIFYDERSRALPETIEADVLALTVETFACKRAYLIADRYRRSGVLVAMGGHHPSMLPDEAAEHADVVLIGDAEDTWPQFISDLKSGCHAPRYNSSGKCSLADVQYDYSVFPKGHYPLVAPVQFGRGCRYSCDFCSVHAFYGSTLRSRPIERVADDIKKLRQKYLFFVDDNLFSSEEDAVGLFEMLRPLGKKWGCQISLDVAKNLRLLHLMKKSGCIMVIIGFESLNRQNLQQMGKGANLSMPDYEMAIDNIYRAGMMIYGTFVIGYDADTKDTANELMQFAIKHRFSIANFNPLMPMPGTPLYSKLKGEGRLPYERWWLHKDFRYGDAMLKPASMSGEELLNSCKSARFRFNSPGNILRRAGNLRANSRSPLNLFIFLVASLVSRREIHFKQSRPLGGPQK